MKFMLIRCLAAWCLGVTASVGAAADARLTPVEARWLAAGAPVLAYAKQHKLPVDIIVQPQETPEHAPLSMGFVDGRCKLVFSMRGNPAVDSTAASIPEHLFGPVAEAVMAHEIGHCWRYVQGVWHTLPAGFVDGAGSGLEDEELVRQVRDMRETRREEGFSDLVGLAWVRLRHPAQYAEVHDWLSKLREHQPVAGAHHDTRSWVRLAADPGVFGTGPTVFDTVWQLWKQGLLADED